MVGSQANDLSADAPTAIDRVRQIEAHFQKNGAFSNGLIADGQLPSVSGHGATRIRSLLTAKQMLGDDEQYAVAMSLMLRHLGIPSRVVMGFYPDPKSPENGAGEVKITGKDVHAWVEVAFDRVGWVSFDPTPPKDNVPIPPDPENKSKPKPQVLQPPPPPQEPADLPPDSSPDALDADEKKNNPWLFWGPLLAAIGIALIPIGILALPLLLIALLKSRRRKTRFTEGPRRSASAAAGTKSSASRPTWAPASTPVPPGASPPSCSQTPSRPPAGPPRCSPPGRRRDLRRRPAERGRGPGVLGHRGRFAEGAHRDPRLLGAAAGPVFAALPAGRRPGRAHPPGPRPVLPAESRRTCRIRIAHRYSGIRPAAAAPVTVPRCRHRVQPDRQEEPHGAMTDDAEGRPRCEQPSDRGRLLHLLRLTVEQPLRAERPQRAGVRSPADPR